MNNIIIPRSLAYDFTTKQKYDAGLFYKKYLLQKEYFPYQFDGWYEKKNYGLIDKNNNIVYPQMGVLKKYYNLRGQEHKNLPFVADAFMALKSFQEEPIRKLRIAGNSIYSRIDPVESTTNVHDHYTVFLNQINNICADFLLKNSLSIKNVNDFIYYFAGFIKIITKATIINRTSFIVSKHCPQSVNGLRISIFNGEDDLPAFYKATNFVNHPEFEKFLELVSRFGFYVDRNFPWVLVADLESYAMKKYLNKYNIETTQQIFTDMYHKADEVDIESLTNVVLAFWNTFASRVGGSQKNIREVKCLNLFKEINTYNQLTYENFTKYFNINLQIRMYLFTRVLEERLNITQSRFENIFEECRTINKYFGMQKCMEFINSKIKELIDASKPEAVNLTSAEEVIKMLSRQKPDIPTEGINF